MATTYNNFSDNTPDISLNVGNTFGIDADFEVPAFAEANEYAVSYTHLTLPTIHRV